MDSRRWLAGQVLECGVSVSAAAREAGVSRTTAYLWVGRARASGMVEMGELSRRPHRQPNASPEEVRSAVMAAASSHPAWGADILHSLLWPPETGPAPVCVRTVARILSRAGRRVTPVREPARAPCRFERSQPNELWQTDFKRVGPRRRRKDALSILDDATRFCIDLRQTQAQTLACAWEVLWEAFGCCGLPDAVLSDNGSAFRNNATWRWSSFDLRLLLLDVIPVHGRPYHPQTQGKVERFHGTVERELVFESGSDLQTLLCEFRDRYNWVRPHRSLDMRPPGYAYKRSTRVRPNKLPEPFFPQGAIVRKCADPGVISYNGERYKLGRAFTGLPIGILNDEHGIPYFVWGNHFLGPIQDLKV